MAASTSPPHAEVRRVTDGKIYSLWRKDASTYGYGIAWSPTDKRLAVVFGKLGGSVGYRIEALDPEAGRWTTLVSSQREYIRDVAWLSNEELIYAKDEAAPRTDCNLWVQDVNPSTGLPSSAAQQRTRWTDFCIRDISASADGSRLCFTKSSVQSNAYVGDLQAKGTRLASLRRLTLEEAVSLPQVWTPESKAVLLQSNRDGRPRIYKQDIDKDSADLITSGPGYQTDPRISPDGGWVLYISHDDTPGRPKTRLVRVPLGGGSSQEILASDDIATFNCSRTAGGACIVIEKRQKVKISSVLDPVKGRGRKILEMTAKAGDPVISPDGQHIAFLSPSTPHNRIQIVDLQGATKQEITVRGAENLQTLQWSADDAGFFSGDTQPTTTRLLHVGRDGASQVVWAQAPGAPVWGIPSPDGRYLATFRTDVSANVWMVENP